MTGNDTRKIRSAVAADKITASRQGFLLSLLP